MEASSFHLPSDDSPAENSIVTVQELLEPYVLMLFSDRYIRITPRDLEREIRQKYLGVQRADIRTVIKNLVRSGVLSYSIHHSISYLERNQSVLRWMTDRIAISQFSAGNKENDNTVCVRLISSAAFGGGDHPTTQLCLKGVEVAVDLWVQQFKETPRSALDIGTGTGVLAIAAVLLGVEKVLAVDIDPFACFEARLNADGNQLTSEQITISDVPISTFYPQQFDLLLANLRPPTLKQLLPDMLNLTALNGIWVVSGFRPLEIGWFTDSRAKHGGEIVWHGQNKNWSAMAIQWRNRNYEKADSCQR